MINFLKANKPDRKWWEIMRIPYNVIMYFAGSLSVYICHITIPFVYLIIGFGLNIFYTFGWMYELWEIRGKADERMRMNYPKLSFLIYLGFSVFIVLGFSLFLLIL